MHSARYGKVYSDYVIRAIYGPYGSKVGSAKYQVDLEVNVMYGKLDDANVLASSLTYYPSTNTSMICGVNRVKPWVNYISGNQVHVKGGAYALGNKVVGGCSIKSEYKYSNIFSIPI